GLPFVPTYDLKVEAPDAARLVVGNEVREGGFRIGQITQIDPIRTDEGTAGAELEVRLDQSAGPIPVDSTVLIRPRSALGLKYVELVRGDSAQELREGSTITATEQAIAPELDEFFSIFDEPTRENIDVNLATFGAAFAGRGQALNRTFAALPELLSDIQPVMRKLSDPDTQLARFFTELDDAAGLSAPLSDTLARGFTEMADTFEAFSRDPQALRDTISGSPPTLDAGLRSFPVQRPFLRRLAGISGAISESAAAVRTSVPAINDALAVGTDVLPETTELNADLATAFRGLDDLASSPTTNITLQGLTTTMDTLNPTLRWLGPHVTVCNHWNYWWTGFADDLAEEDGRTGTLMRVQAKNSPEQDNTLNSFGAAEPANAEGVVEPTTELFGDPVLARAQQYGAAVNSEGLADCEDSQRGYLNRFAGGQDGADGVPERFNVVVDSDTPGLQGTTFTGRDRVPEGQTFSSEPDGIAPPRPGVGR
nr:MCE family protein [Thermoleophilaceae bacterium]